MQIPGGTFHLGAGREEPFVFDNEKWAHPVLLRPFAIARAPVTQAEFSAFVADDGYRRSELWGPAGWRWRQAGEVLHPIHWRREGNGWLRRDFDRWLPLEPHRPVIHVNWYEAEAYCRWAGRRLPTEAEWETAAAASGNDLSAPKRRFPWGNEPPNPTRAQLDGYRLGCCNVADLPAGDSHFGCRQMIGNVWEWTASDPCVVIPVHTQHYLMLQRNLLYTGITRGRKLVVLVGAKKALALAVRRGEANRRFTALRRRLRA